MASFDIEEVRRFPPLFWLRLDERLFEARLLRCLRLLDVLRADVGMVGIIAIISRVVRP